MIVAHPPATKSQQGFAATKCRNDVAMGVSPWEQNAHRAVNPEGTTGTVTQPIHVAPPGLRARFYLPIHGLAPVATACRPFGTDVLTPGRYVGAEEVEDDGVPFAEKMEGLTRELATQFHESEKLRADLTALRGWTISVANSNRKSAKRSARRRGRLHPH